MHHTTPVFEQKPIQLGFTFLLSHITIASFSFPILSPRASWNKRISHSPVAEDYPDLKCTRSRKTGVFLLRLHHGEMGSVLPCTETTWDRAAAQRHARRAWENTFQKLEMATETAGATGTQQQLNDLRFFPHLKMDFCTWWDLIRFPSWFFRMNKVDAEFGLWLVLTEASSCEEGSRHPSPNTTALLSF